MTYTVTPVAGYNATPPPDDGSHVASNVPKWADVKTKLADPVKDAIDTNLADIAAEFVLNAAKDITVTTNGNGTYIRFPQIAYQICLAEITTGSISTTDGAIYRSSTVAFTWPAAFTGAPWATHNVKAGAVGAWSSLGNANITATGGQLHAKNTNNSSGIALIGIIGIGPYTP